MSFVKLILTSFFLVSFLSVVVLTLFYMNINSSHQSTECIAAKERNDSTLYSLENPRWLLEVQTSAERDNHVQIPFYNDTRYTSYPLDIDMVKLVKYYRKGLQYASATKINEYPYSFTTKPEVTCLNSTKLLILIKSAPRNREKRQAIRETWGNEDRISGFKRVFVLGKSRTDDTDIEQEIQTSKDILLIDYYDSYYMNTWKTRGALIWASSCKECDYVMLVDDDYYVATDLLIQQLELTGTGNETLYMGWVNPRSYPFRWNGSKWYISPTDYPYNIYPPFVSAGSIVMSMKFVADFVIASQFTKHIKFDDVFLAIVANKLGVAPINNRLFYTGKVDYWDKQFWTTLTAHGYNPAELRNAWQCHRRLKTNGLNIHL